MEGRVGLRTLEMRIDMRICLHLKWPLHFPSAKKETTQIAVRVLANSPNIKFNDDLFTGFPVALGLRTNRRRNFHRHSKRI